uniref:G protein-coupled receptor n=1 Tax=Panagrellus redivivus TaxID=6233 RepID=A0A7E4VU32_PANRE
MQVLGFSLYERTFRFYNIVFACVLTYIFNGILLYAVVTKSSKWLGPYLKMFYTEIFINIAFVTTSVLTGISYFSAVVNGHFCFFHIVAGVINEPSQPWTTLLVLPCVFFLNWNITIVPVHFVYRYFAVCRNYEMSLKTFLASLALSALGPAIYVGAIGIGEFKDDHLRASVAHVFQGTDWMSPNGNPPSFAVMIADGITLHTVIVPISTLVSYSIVAVCAIAISLRVGRMRKIQDTTHHRKNFQLNLVLLCHALVPFIVSALPSGGVQTAKIFGLKMPAFVGYITLLTPYSSVANPIMALLIVSPYRRFWLRPIQRKVFPKGPVAGKLFASTTNG